MPHPPNPDEIKFDRRGKFPRPTLEQVASLLASVQHCDRSTVSPTVSRLLDDIHIGLEFNEHSYTMLALSKLPAQLGEVWLQRSWIDVVHAATNPGCDDVTRLQAVAWITALAAAQLTTSNQKLRKMPFLRNPVSMN